MSVGICHQELENILVRIPKEELEEIKKSIIAKDYSKIKTILKKHVSVADCLNVDNIKKYIVRKLLSDSVDVADVVTAEIVLDIPPKGSVNTSIYPCYSVSEILYVSLFDANPSIAHEKMYEVLEPILLTDKFSNIERKSLFLPVNLKNWDQIQNALISILRKLDDERRRVICSNLPKFFHLFFYCFKVEVKTSITSKAQISGVLLKLCPELKKVVLRGVI